MTKKNCLIASALALTVVFAMLFSVCFMIAEANHNCIGEGCPICYQIDVCNHILRSIGFAVTAAVLSAHAGLFAYALSSSLKKSADNTSLVSLKVKLSD